MRKLQLTSRRVLATLMAVVLLAVLIPTVLTDKAMAADYVERDGEYYFWTEGGPAAADCGLPVGRYRTPCAGPRGLAL